MRQVRRPGGRVGEQAPRPGAQRSALWPAGNRTGAAGPRAQQATRDRDQRAHPPSQRRGRPSRARPEPSRRAVPSSGIHAQDADLNLYPPVNGAGLLDFQAFDDRVETGYLKAAEDLQRWWSLGSSSSVFSESDK